MSDLKKCPCGGEALLVKDRMAQKLWRVSCKNCDASPLGGYSMEDAIAAWNRRSAPAVPDGWVMVPRRPDENMKSAVRDIAGPEALAYALAGWNTFISAAPAAPNGWQPIETAPKDRPIAIEYKSGSGWKVTGAQWNKYKRLWETPLVTLLPHEIARWHELPNGLDNPDAKSPAENSDD